MPKEIFRFKRFTITQSPETGVKVGTDGVLLGAWCRVEQTPARLLDAGTGTGIIALMLAQRTPETARIDAIDIDPDCAERAALNAEASPWAERIRILNKTIQSHAATRAYPRQSESMPQAAALRGWAEKASLYDHIAANPPYFTSSLLPPTQNRTTARHTVSLTHGDLLRAVDTLLAPEGRFSVILPPKEAAALTVKAISHGLSASRITEVFTKPGGPCKRVLTEFVRTANYTETQRDTLTIAGTAAEGFSQQYIALTRDFYLKF